jgi:hypothetical protein
MISREHDASEGAYNKKKARCFFQIRQVSVFALGVKTLRGDRPLLEKVFGDCGNLVGWGGVGCKHSTHLEM